MLRGRPRAEGRPPARKAGAWIMILLFGAAGILVAGTGLYSFGHWAGFALRAETAEGVVLGVVPAGRRSVVPVFRYEAPAGEVAAARSRNPNSWARFAPGDAVTLRVDPSRPDWAEADSLALLLFGPLLMLPFGAILIGVAVLTRRGQAGQVGTRMLLCWLALPATALLAMVAGFISLNETLATRAERRNTAWAQAQVEAVEASSRIVDGRPVPYAHYPRLVFTTADGERVRINGPSNASPRHAVGDTVALRYRRAAPAGAVEASVWDFWLRPAAFGLGAILACIPLLLVLRGVFRNPAAAPVRRV